CAYHAARHYLRMLHNVSELEVTLVSVTAGGLTCADLGANVVTSAHRERTVRAGPQRGQQFAWSPSEATRREQRLREPEDALASSSGDRSRASCPHLVNDVVLLPCRRERIHGVFQVESPPLERHVHENAGDYLAAP